MKSRYLFLSEKFAGTKKLLEATAHRPWPMPEGAWRYYQEWNHALFFHWKADKEELRKLIPADLELDTFEGQAWISLVPFTMEKIRPVGLPAVATVSTFHEINVRTYVTRDNKPGVYFLNIEAEKHISSIASRVLSGLPYEKADIVRRKTETHHTYSSINKNKAFHLDAAFNIGEKIKKNTPLDSWLTERYCLYLDKNNKTFRYEVHHQSWPLYELNLVNLKTDYTIGKIKLNQPPDLTHYSDGVKVVAWKRVRVKK